METTIKKAPLTLTDSAIKALLEIRESENIPDDHGLRIGVKGGGCSGMSYILGFDMKKESDVEYEIGELPVYIDNAHGMYLIGMEIDYVDGLSNRGFTFNNPNAKETCGCGTSFSA